MVVDNIDYSKKLENVQENMENTRVKVELEIKPEMALLLGMVLHGGTYGYNVVSKLLTPKSLKDLHDIVIDQVESERDMATYEKELLTRLNPEELAFFKELRSAESKK